MFSRPKKIMSKKEEKISIINKYYSETPNYDSLSTGSV